jgi:hypothetical protein
MFAFQPSSLHISKDISYYSNKLVSSLIYQILTTFSGCRWVVVYGHYRIIGYSLIDNFKTTVLMSSFIRYIIKIMNEEHIVLDPLP